VASNLVGGDTNGAADVFVRSPLHVIPWTLIGTELTVLPVGDRKIVALTFDCGGNDDGVPSILATLRANSVPATFFMTGRWTEVYPSQAATIATSYPVGDHTFSHAHLRQLSDSGVRSEVIRGRDAVFAATGIDTHPLFRFPFGESDGRTIGLVNGLGYSGIRWSIDTLGWKGTSGGQSVGSIVHRVLDNLRPGGIVLMHVGSNPDDGSTLDADALPLVIAELRARGYTFATVDAYA
jgi:peptidoglycan/xylan/chitin deacetylase (PgdA/CDA1 family)